MKENIENIYFLLRDEGYSTQSIAIKKLLFCFEQNDLLKFKKTFKSAIIWGGAGSVRDISLRDDEKQKKLDDYLKLLYDFTKSI